MNQTILHKDREAIRTPDMLVGKHYLTNDNHSIPSAMSDFITELLTLAVYCNFLLLLLEFYKDREAIQTPDMFIREMA